MSRPTCFEFGSSNPHRSTTIVARLDKTGHWVCCGRLECGARLSPIDLLDPTPRDYCEWLIQFENLELISEWTLGPGWKLGTDKVWIPTNRSLQRLSRARALAEGTVAAPHSGPDGIRRVSEEARRRLSEGRWLMNRKPSPKYYGGESDSVLYHNGRRIGPNRLARCWRCPGINRLEDCLARDLWDLRLSIVRRAAETGEWDYTEFVERLAVHPERWDDGRVVRLDDQDRACVEQTLAYLTGQSHSLPAFLLPSEEDELEEPSQESDTDRHNRIMELAELQRQKLDGWQGCSR